VQGFATGLACALPFLGELDDELALLPLVDDPESFEPPSGIDREELAGMLSALCYSIERDLEDGRFRPYMGERYVNRIKADTPCAEWCRAFSISSLLTSEEIREDEDLKTHFVPILLLGGLTVIEELLPEASQEEKAETEALARKDLVPSVKRIFQRYRGSDEDE